VGGPKHDLFYRECAVFGEADEVQIRLWRIHPHPAARADRLATLPVPLRYLARGGERAEPRDRALEPALQVARLERKRRNT